MMLTRGITLSSDHHIHHFPSKSIIPLKNQVVNCCSKSDWLPGTTFLSYPRLKASYRCHACTLERTPTLVEIGLNLWQKTSTKLKQRFQEAATGGGDDGTGSGGRGGGGGRGGRDSDDDDDEDGEDDEDEYDMEDHEDKGGIFHRRRHVQPEIFDKETENAVLSEWMTTSKDLPLGLGLMSSAQFTRFLCFNTWPQKLFLRKVIADPTFLKKLFLEVVASSCCSIWSNYKDGKQKWDVVLIKMVTASLCNSFVFCSLSHSCNNIQLPNNVFETSYDIQKMALSFFYKAVTLFMFGSAVKAAEVNLLTIRSRRTMAESAYAVVVDHGLFLGFHANLRYQLLFGIDRALVDYFDVMEVAFLFGSAARIFSVWSGAKEASSHDLQPLAASWFLIKNAVQSVIGLVYPSKQCTELDPQNFGREALFPQKPNLEGLLLGCKLW